MTSSSVTLLQLREEMEQLLARTASVLMSPQPGIPSKLARRTRSVSPTSASFARSQSRGRTNFASPLSIASHGSGSEMFSRALTFDVRSDDEYGSVGAGSAGLGRAGILSLPGTSKVS